MQQASSEASSGFPYQLTEEDRAKGRSTVTPKRIMANRLNPVKSGKYSKNLTGDFLYCNSCSLQKACAFFQYGSNCRIVNIPTYKNLARLWQADPADFLKETSRALMELHTAIKVSGNNPKYLSNYVSLLVKVFEAKFGSRHLIGLQQPQQKIVVVGYKGTHGLDQLVCCKKCDAEGPLNEIVEFLPDKPSELEPLRLEEPAEPVAVDTITTSDVSGAIADPAPEKQKELEKPKKEELMWPYGHKPPYL